MTDGPDFDPFLYGALYGIARNQRMNQPGYGRHSHAPGQYHAHPGFQLAHAHPVAHSLDYVLAEHWKAYVAGATTATFRVGDPLLQALYGGGIGGFLGLLLGAPVHEVVMVALAVVGAILGNAAAKALATRELDIINYVDGGARWS